MIRSFLALSISLACLAAPASAGQKLYVLNKDSRDVTVIDTWTGTPLGSFRTKSSPLDLDAGHLDEFVVIAANNDIGWLDSRNGYKRIDLEFESGDAERGSVAIGLSPDDQHLYLAQTDEPAVYKVHLGRGAIQDCIDHPLEDGKITCRIPTSARELWWAEVAAPKHLAVCDDGAVYLVGETGQISRNAPGTSGMTLLGVTVPTDPRGIACTPENGVAIMSANGTLTELGPGSSPSVAQYPNLALQDPGRIDVDPRMFGVNYHVLATDSATGELVRFENGAEVERILLRTDPNGAQPLPEAVAAGATGMLGTANQGAEGATILYSSWSHLFRKTGAQPIDVDLGPVLGAAVLANPYSVQFVYGPFGSQNQYTQNVVLKSVGTGPLEISSLQIVGSSVFRVSDPNRCTSQTLQPGDTCTVVIGFTNPGTGGQPTYPHYNADLRVVHNGSPTPVSDFPLKAIHFKQWLAEHEELSFAEEPFLQLQSSGE